MAEAKLLKAGSGASDFAQFGSTDTIPAANMPAASVISPSQITSDQDNYNPTGWADADVVRLDFDTGGRAITGFTAWTNTRPKTIINTSANFAYIPCAHPDSTSTNTVIGICDHIIAPYGTLILEYDDTSDRVRVVANSYNYAEPPDLGKGHFFQVCPGATLGSDWPSVGMGISGGDNGTNTPTATLPGAWYVTTTTSASGASSLYLAKTINSLAFFGSAHLICSTYVYFNTLSDGTNTYTFSSGLVTGANSTTLAVNNSITIQYTHGTNSGKWLGVSRDNAGAQSTVDLGTTVATNTPYVLTICFDKARAEARFYVDGVYAGRVTGNMPNAVTAGLRNIIVKSAGTTARDAYIANMSFLTIF